MIHATASIYLSHEPLINENKTSNVQSVPTNLLCYRSLLCDFIVVGLFNNEIIQIMFGIEAMVDYKFKMEVISNFKLLD